MKVMFSPESTKGKEDGRGASGLLRWSPAARPGVKPIQFMDGALLREFWPLFMGNMNAEMGQTLEVIGSQSL